MFWCASVPLPAWSADNDAGVSAFLDKDFGYELSYPSTFMLSNKPVKTHLSESVLKSPMRGVQLGITVDPVRIASLEQFGTLEEAMLLIDARAVESLLVKFCSAMLASKGHRSARAESKPTTLHDTSCQT